MWIGGSRLSTLPQPLQGRAPFSDHAHGLVDLEEEQHGHLRQSCRPTLLAFSTQSRLRSEFGESRGQWVFAALLLRGVVL
jgi:hypothetical protein